MPSDEYSMGPERFLSAAMPVHGYADFLILLRGNKNSALQPKVPDSCDCHVLRYLSVMGRKRVHRALPGCCVVRSTLGGIMVAKKLASLPLSVFYDCVGDRAVLLAHARNVHLDRKSTRLNSSHLGISYAVFCLKKKKEQTR